MLGATGAAAVILSACGAGQSATEMANETPPVTPSSGTMIPPAPTTSTTTIVPLPDYPPADTGPGDESSSEDSGEGESAG
jgi:hypothetical protein